MKQLAIDVSVVWISAAGASEVGRWLGRVVGEPGPLAGCARAGAARRNGSGGLPARDAQADWPRARCEGAPLAPGRRASDPCMTTWGAGYAGPQHANHPAQPPASLGRGASRAVAGCRSALRPSACRSSTLRPSSCRPSTLRPSSCRSSTFRRSAIGPSAVDSPAIGLSVVDVSPVVGASAVVLSVVDVSSVADLAAIGLSAVDVRAIVLSAIDVSVVGMWAVGAAHGRAVFHVKQRVAVVLAGVAGELLDRARGPPSSCNMSILLHIWWTRCPGSIGCPFWRSWGRRPWRSEHHARDARVVMTRARTTSGRRSPRSRSARWSRSSSSGLRADRPCA